MPPPGEPRIIVLVGLPGAGKSTVGAILAQRTGRELVDLDTEIERETGLTVSDIFARHGEAAFRRMEREASAKLAARERLVLAAGGGWMLDPANAASLGEGVMTVYLRLSPEAALDRLRRELATRPLLAVPDPLTAIRALFELRDSIYLQANHTLAVDSMPAEIIADTIVALATGPTPD